ncbi:hypothetical protein [Streptomyces sp. NPDC058953]|uniref:hypothetical protein n=1 Tax=unclassified Streptomyces TaxID=2593676 RepID=UPI0036C630EF
MMDHHPEPCAPGGLCAFDERCGRRGSTVRPIDPRMPELARCLTLFQYVQAVTGGPVARIEQAGSYAVPSLRGEAFAVRPGSIALRVDGAGLGSAGVVDDRDTGGVALHLYDTEGRTAHRGSLLSEGDRLLAGLARTAAPGALAAAPPPAAATTSWEDGDQLAQLDEILVDGGIARRAAFDRYRGGHRAVDAGVVPDVLDYVCSAGLPVGIAVFAPAAAMQASSGRIHVTDRTVGGRVFAAIAESTVEIDLPGVRACRLVRTRAAHGPTSAIELDDADGRCVAVITQFGIVGERVHTDWEHLAASLPDA